MYKKFEFLEHTADLEFVSSGRTLNEVFENSALAFFTSILNLNSIEIKLNRKIGVSANDIETLLHDWLNELLFLFEVEFLVFREFKVKISKQESKEIMYKLSARAFGEELNLKRHIIDTEIKAITYHNLFVEKKDSLWSARVLCDI